MLSLSRQLAGGFFGPLLPLKQYALVCYNPNKIRCRSLYYIDGATCDILNFLKNLLSFELLHFSFSLNQKTILWNMPNFQVHIYHLSKFFFVRNLTFLIYCRFSIFPPRITSITALGFAVHWIRSLKEYRTYRWCM